MSMNSTSSVAMAEGLAKRARDPQLLQATSSKDAAYSKELKEAVTPLVIPPTSKHSKGVRSLAIAVATPLLLGFLVASLPHHHHTSTTDTYTSESDAADASASFYDNIRKPVWSPAPWLMSLLWSVLYPTMGLASWLVWANGGWRRQRFALATYVAQLALNLLWPWFFFRLNNLQLAMADIFALALLLGPCLKAFSAANHVAGNLMKPYVAWVVFSAILNYRIWVMNYMMPAVTLDDHHHHHHTSSSSAFQ